MLILFCGALSEVLGQLPIFIFDVEPVISLISAIVSLSLYTSPSYIFNFNRLWCTRLNASANVLMVFVSAPHHLMSLVYRFLMNKNIITLLVTLAGSIPITFSVKSVTFWMYSCSVSSGLCLWCRLLAVCTSVVIGKYTSSSFLWCHANLSHCLILSTFCRGYWLIWL